MIHPIPENKRRTPVKINWWKRCGIALLAGSLAGLLFWSFTGRFSSGFTIITGLILSCMWEERIHERYSHGARAGNMLADFCTHWRCTRRGILIFCKQGPRPCLFLPWESLRAATPCENGISLEDAGNDTFYELPIAEGLQAEYLARIQEAIRLHHPERDHAESGCWPVYYTMSPHQLPTWRHLQYPLPWVALSLLSPWLWPGEIIACVMCFALAAAFGSHVLTDFENDWGSETYAGEEMRRSERGMRFRMNGGIRCFIPWSSFTEGTQLEDNHAFLQLRGGLWGIVLTASSSSIPIALTRRFLKRHRLARSIGQLALLIIFTIIGGLWACWWR